MFNNKFPYFAKGRILKQSMLENLRDYPRNFIDLYFQDYSNGIIAGSNLLIEDDYIHIKRGVIKFGGVVYILDKSQNLNYTNTNKEMVIKFRVAQIEETEDFRTYNSEIFFDNKIELKEDEFELGRFKLREGAELRSNYNDFLDFSTKYNTINIINVKYANVEKHTLHPLIIRTFAKKLLKASYDNNLDTIFAMESLNSKTIDRDVIISYLVRRLGIAEKGYTNLELYEYMKKIVKELSGVKLNEERRDKGPKKIIVD